MPFLAPIGLALGASAGSAALVGTIATAAVVGTVASGVSSIVQAGAANKAAKAQQAAVQANVGPVVAPSVTDANAVAASSVQARRATYTSTLLTSPQGIAGEPTTGKTLLGQ